MFIYFVRCILLLYDLILFNICSFGVFSYYILNGISFTSNFSIHILIEVQFKFIWLFVWLNSRSVGISDSLVLVFSQWTCEPNMCVCSLVRMRLQNICHANGHRVEFIRIFRPALERNRKEKKSKTKTKPEANPNNKYSWMVMNIFRTLVTFSIIRCMLYKIQAIIKMWLHFKFTYRSRNTQIHTKINEMSMFSLFR